MRAKPVDLPPPNAVRNPKQTITSEVVLYVLASCSLSSALGTFGRPGCNTSTILRGRNWSVNVYELSVSPKIGHHLSSPSVFAEGDDL